MSRALGILLGHLADRRFGDPRRGWDFVTVGYGDVPWDKFVRALNYIGYQGPLSIEWEDSGMDRIKGVKDALETVRQLFAEGFRCCPRPAPSSAA